MDPVKSTAQTSLHSVLGIIAAIPSQVICYANSSHIFFLTLIVTWVRQRCLNLLFHQITS